MELTIIQYGPEVIPEVMEKIKEEIATVKFKTARANDPLDALAFARTASDNSDQIMMFIQIPEEQKHIRNAFYNGLAHLEASTGKTIIKDIYTDIEEPDIEKAVDELVKSTL